MLKYKHTLLFNVKVADEQTVVRVRRTVTIVLAEEPV